MAEKKIDYEGLAKALGNILKKMYPGAKVEVFVDEPKKKTRRRRTKDDIDRELINRILRELSTLKIVDYRLCGDWYFVYTYEEHIEADFIVELRRRLGINFSVMPYKMRYLKFRFYVKKREDK